MFKKVTRVLSTVFLVVLILFVVAMLIMRLMGHTPSVFGYRVYAVTTGSMEPTLKVGDAILIKKTPPEEIHKGDIITYLGSEDEMYDKPVTHRVVAEPEEKNGKYYFQTQGDAAGATLDPITTYDRVEGKMLHKIPLFGKLYTFFCKPYGLLTFVIIIFILFGYEMISLVVSYKKIDSADLDALEPVISGTKKEETEEKPAEPEEPAEQENGSETPESEEKEQ